VWDPETVWTFWGTEQIFACAGIATSDCSARSIVTVLSEVTQL